MMMMMMMMHMMMSDEPLQALKREMHVNVEVAQHGATRTYSVQNRPSAYTSASLFEIWISDFGVSTQTKIDPTAPTLSPALYFSFFLS